MPEGKRPGYMPNPPPHTYLGHSPWIYTNKLAAWALTLGDMRGVKKRGRPTARSKQLNQSVADLPPCPAA